MNREQAKAALETIQAFAEGKQVQYMSLVTGRWEDDEDPAFDFNGFEYRIKPEEPKRKYRPYKDHHEFLSQNSTYNWFKEKGSDTDATYLIEGFCSKGILIDGVWKEWQDLLDNFTFDDGTIIGIEEEV